MNQTRFVDDINDVGFTVHQDVFDKDCISELNQYASTFAPERGHTKDLKWWGWNQISEQIEKGKNPHNEIDWAYFWTAEPKGNNFIDNIIKPELGKCADAAFGENNWEWYMCDFIVLHPGMNFIRPHIDTPYRFKEFKYAKGLLGLQFMVMLCDFTPDNGATGYVPGSHKYIYDYYQDLYVKNAHFDIFFQDNYKQHTAPKGSFVCWHPRVLHSSMPNKSDGIRRGLLLHAAEKQTARRLKTVDPQKNQSLRTS